MLEKTKNPFIRLYNSIKTIGFMVSLLSQLLFLGYYVYSIIFGVGYYFANLAFLIISLLYLLASIVFFYKDKQIDKSTKKIIKKIYKYSKYLVNFLIICVSFYTVSNNIGNVQFFTKIFLAFKAGGYVLLIVFDCLIFSIGRKIDRIINKKKNQKQI